MNKTELLQKEQFKATKIVCCGQVERLTLDTYVPSASSNVIYAIL